MDLLDLSVTSAKGNRYVLVMVDCFSRWTEACPLPDKTALSVDIHIRGRDVYAFPVIFARGSVHPSHRPQLPPMAAEVPE